MPLFVFLSGLFIRNEQQSKKQCQRAICTYLAMMMLLLKNPLKPYWHLWYLLSLAGWSFFGLLWKKINRRWLQWVLIGISLAAGCAAGLIPEINRWFSLSRTIVFMPYYLLGMMSNSDSENPVKAIGALVLGVLLYLCIRRHITPDFLYHAESYTDPPTGILNRCICYAIGGCWGYGLWQLRWKRRFSWTEAGTDTLWIYILHAPMVLFFRSLQIEMPIVATVIIIRVCYQVTRWSRPLFILKGRGADHGSIQGRI